VIGSLIEQSSESIPYQWKVGIKWIALALGDEMPEIAIVQGYNESPIIFCRVTTPFNKQIFIFKTSTNYKTNFATTRREAASELIEFRVS